MELISKLEGFLKFFDRIAFVKLNSRFLYNKLISIDEDLEYKINFKESAGKEIYRLHIEKDFKSCAFCKNLLQNGCHSYCFSCRVKPSLPCNNVLPDILYETPFKPGPASGEPWLLAKPCSSFQRLTEVKYFSHFDCFNTTVTVAGYEFTEGLFLGISNGQKPCHVCSLINKALFRKCYVSDKITPPDQGSCPYTYLFPARRSASSESFDK